MPVPQLDASQRQAASAKATESRRIRAELKQMLKSGEVSLSEVLARADDTEPLARMRVSDLLESMPAIGAVKARKAMEQIGISQTRRIQGLGPRQREQLLERFASRSRSSGRGSAPDDDW